MNLLMRDRLKRVIAYHESVAEQAKKTLEPTPPRQEGQEGESEGEGTEAEQQQQQQAAPPQDDPKYAMQKSIFDMHTEAAKQLREVLDSFPMVSGIEQARNDPNRVMRDPRVFPRVGPGGGFVSSGVIH